MKIHVAKRLRSWVHKLRTPLRKNCVRRLRRAEKQGLYCLQAVLSLKR